MGLLSNSTSSSCVHGTFCQLSIFCPSAGLSVNFHQLSVHQRDLPSTSVNFPCVSGTFHKLSVHPWDFPSTFRVFAGPSVIICQLPPCASVYLLTFRVAARLSVNFCACAGLSVDFHQLMCVRGSFHLSVFSRRLSSAFRMAVGLPVHLWDLLSTSVNFPCIHSTFHQLPSTFCAPAGSSVNNLHGHRTYCQHQSIDHAFAGLTVNLRQLFVRPGDLLSTFRLAG